MPAIDDKVENAFGILSNRFRIFHTSISVNLETVDKIVMATCVLHNFLRRRYATVYTPENNLYRENMDAGTIELGLEPIHLISLQPSHNRRCEGSQGDVHEFF